MKTTKMKRAFYVLIVAVLCAFSSFLFAACAGEDWGAWEVTKAATCTEDGEKIRYKNSDKSVFEKRTIPALGHDYGDWHTVTPSTHTSEGLEERTCKRCAHVDPRDIPMIPVTYYIDIKDADGELIERVYTDDAGAYELEDPVSVGYEFIRFKKADGTEFAKSGTIDKSIDVIADFSLLPTTTFDQLYERAEAGAKQIMIAADITVGGSVYITGKTEIFAESDHALVRAANFGGDMFVVGENEAGENTLLSGEASALTLSTKNKASLTIDGNKSAMTVDVGGAAILVLNSATVTMNDGVGIKNCKKTANAKLLNSDYKVSYPERVGGAAIIVVNGVFEMNGGIIADNEVNIDETDAVTDETDGESNRVSSCGGAIYNYSTVNINGGEFKNNSAARGGAIYNYRTTTVKAATFSNNSAGVYAGAVYLPQSQYAAIHIGVENAETNDVLFSGNTAEKSGGALFGQMKNTIVVYGGAVFSGNTAKGNNGGAINTSGALIIKNAEFSDNVAASKGGAIYLYYSDETLTVRQIEIARGSFVGNRASKGGAIAFSSSDPQLKTGAIGVIGVSEEAAPTAEGDTADIAPYVVFRNNEAYATATEDPELPESDDDGAASDGTTLNYNGNGGAIYIARRANVTLNNVRFDTNTAERKGGAVYITADGTVFDDNGSNYLNNTSGGNGGAVYGCKGADVDISGSTFQNNKSDSTEYGGGAVYLTASVGNISASKFIGNSSAKNGGAVSAYSSTDLTVTNCAFNGNVSTNNGGAMYSSKSQVDIVDSDFNNNTSNSTEYGGGAVYFTASVGNISGSDFIGNTSEKSGGAVSSYSNTTITVANSLFKNNTAKVSTGNAGGGALYLSGGTATLTSLEFKSNKSDRHGGAFCAYSQAQVSVTDISATGNIAADNGGVIYIGSEGTVVSIYSGSASSNTATKGATINCGSKSTLKIKTSAFTCEDGSIAGTVNNIAE